MNREKALELLKKYNKDPFHIRHGLTVEKTMRWFAKELGYANEEDFWGNVGLLHDLDFELYPEEHCVKCQEIMKNEGLDEHIIRATACHGWGMTKTQFQPEHQMEKILFACDELTGLIGAAALMRPSKSTKDMELKSLKKKFKDKKFTAGCNRDVITQGAQNLGWQLDELLDKTLKAMQSFEDELNKELQ